MHRRQFSSIYFNQTFWQMKLLLVITGAFLLLVASPAMAHHAMGGRTPSNFLEGFLTGLAHPLIGLDHFAFIVAVGLLSAIKRQGILVAIAFILSAMLGTGFHILSFSLPGAELLVAASVLLFGILLVMKDSPNMFMIAALAAIAGVFHGYAYGEAIFGAEITPLLSYLVGFTVIQVVVAVSTFAVSRTLLQRHEQQKMPTSLRSAGLALCGIGAAFFSLQLVSAILPMKG